MINTGIKILLGLTACLAGGNVYASCEMVQRSDLSVPASPIIGTVALNATVSAPADMPLGTILYRGVFNRPIQVAIKCTEQGQFYTLQKMATSAGTLGKAEDFNPPVPVGSVVFKTSMPGVGFALNSGYTVYDVPHAAAVCVNSSNCIWNGDSIVNAASIMYLIKTGPITPGTIIGASLPVYSELFGQDGFMVTTMAMPFTGSITVPPPSCTTPDVAVEMGTWSVGDFRGKGSGTEWQDTSIRMTGCDNFYGYRAGHNLDNGGTASLSEPVYKNKYTVSLSPQSAAIDSNSGIMSVAEGDNSASGVGIQIGMGSVASAESRLVTFGNPYQQDISSAGSTMTFPLAARYIQTNERLRPGKADGKVTFTIAYK